MKAKIHFEALTEAHVASACQLSSQAGWNQNEEDWRRLLHVNPKGVKVWIDGGEVRASFSVVHYEQDAAWIGMILVDTAYRGGGVGKSAFEGALELAHSTKCKTIGLDATDMGEPLYRKYGFEVIGPIVRWGGTLDISGGESFEILNEITPEILALDRQCTKTDRGDLLRAMVADGAKILIDPSKGNRTAYGILREGRQSFHLGPIVAKDEKAFREILIIAGKVLAGQKVICDALSPQAEQALFALGLKPLRHLKRMTLPLASGCLSGPGIWCGAGFELG